VKRDIATVETPAPDRLDEPVVRRIELIAVGPEREIREHDTRDAGAPTLARSLFTGRAVFLTLFALPVAASLLYFGFIASDLYVSEAKFIVRSATRSDGSGIAMLMQNQGMARAIDETYSVNEYMLSRDAAVALRDENDLRAVMSRDGADMFSRYPSPFLEDTQERFYRAFRNLVGLEVDATTGISTMAVKAFNPADATAIAAALLAKGQDFINRLNIRANQDALAFSEALVREAQARLGDVQARLTLYRNTELILDPEREVASEIAAAGKLATEIARLEAALTQQTAMAPKSPSLVPLREQISALRIEMAKQRERIVGGSASMATKLQGYEMLTLERELTAKGLTAAVVELEKARQEAMAQRIYLQPIVGPSQPDQPMLPRRLLGVLAVAAVSFCVYWIARNLIQATLDHEA
jgi:capsular polysaccharide transport system permease protein